MSNSKHVSDDLRLALRVQDDDYEGFIDLEVEEEEEEEEEGDPDDDLLDAAGDEDRGDDVDDSLADDDQDDEDADDDEDDDADDDGSGDGAQQGNPEDLELLEELAGDGSRAKMVPHARFHEVNEGYKQERAERLRLQEELARVKGQGGADGDDGRLQKQEPAAFDFEAAEERFMDAILEGDKEEAARIRKEIREEERKQLTKEAEESALRVTEKEKQARAAQADQLAAQTVLVDAIKKYPFLDHEGAEANADAIEEVIALRDHYQRQGKSFAQALATAVEKVGSRYAPKDEPQDTKGKKTQELTAAQIQRNLDREKKIPANMPGVGERGKDVDYSALSEDEFDALPEAEKRRARGDFVKEDA